MIWTWQAPQLLVICGALPLPEVQLGTLPQDRLIDLDAIQCKSSMVQMYKLAVSACVCTWQWEWE